MTKPWLTTLLLCGSMAACAHKKPALPTQGAIEPLDAATVCAMADAISPKNIEQECLEKLTELQAVAPDLYAKVLACVGAATDEAALDACNDKDNPNYQ